MLRESDELPVELHIRVDDRNLIYVQGATQIVPNDFLSPYGVDALIKVFNKGVDNRKMRSTDINETSSRSHLLFCIRVEKSSKATKELVSVGKLTFIDLAGSERLANIGFEENLYEEGLFINESVQCLGKLIDRLATGKQVTSYHFKWNLLTHLLMDSIGPASQTLMVVNISPSVYDLEATRQSLLFAEMTGRIKSQDGVIPGLI